MEFINLIVQYVNDARPERQAEYEECFRRNLANPLIKTVQNLQERPGVIVPEEFVRHPKYRQHPLNRWLTYADAFAYANSTLPGETCCLTNLDICLDNSSEWPEIEGLLSQQLIFCLSRTEYSLDGKTWLDENLLKWALAVSQDAWIFRAPVHIENCDFGIGTLGCDNAIAHRIKKSGYTPVNASQQFKIFHLDRARDKTYINHIGVYNQERQGDALGQFPERQGQYLLPDIDLCKSVDQILNELKVDDLRRYIVVCEVLSKFVKLRNEH